MTSGLRPALFLDRDGVINVDRPYVCKPDDFEFIDGIFDLCRKANAAGMVIVAVTNQAGIGRGLYTEQQFHHLTNWMCAQFSSNGVTIDAVYFCPFHPEHGIGRYKKDSFDRKPNPGMLLRAEKDLGLDLARSVLIGNKLSDIDAAQAAGLKNIILFSGVVKSVEPVPYIHLSSLQEIANYLFAHDVNN